MKRLFALLLTVCMVAPIFVACQETVPPEVPDTQPATEPPVTEPPVTEPPVTEPPVTEPPVTEPPVTEPPATEPPATEPPMTEPHATEPPVTEPPATEPPVTEPPATEPPATEPPVTEPPATEPPATEPPMTEPPATELPATEPPATEPPVTAEKINYKFYEKWQEPWTFYHQVQNDFVRAIIPNALSSVFITAQKSGTLCWFFVVSDNEIPSADNFLDIVGDIETPIVKYRDFEEGFEGIGYEKVELPVKAGHTVEVEINGYQAVVIALKEKNGKYSECLTVRNPGLTLELNANMDTEGIEYDKSAIETIGTKHKLRFDAKADGVVYARVFCDPNVLNGVKSILATVYYDKPDFVTYGIGKGEEQTFDFVDVHKGGKFTLDLSYTIEFYSNLIGFGNVWKTGDTIKVEPGSFWVRDIGDEERQEILEALYLCIQLVDGEDFYKPIVIRFDELIK